MLGLAHAETVPGRSGIIRGALLGLFTGLLGLTRAEGLVVGVAGPRDLDPPASPIRAAPLRTGRARMGYRAHRRLSPWTIRNAMSLTDWNASKGAEIGVRLPTFVPVTAYGPLNFALANNAQSTGGFSRSLLSSRQEHAAVLDLADPQHRHYFLHGTREGLRWIAGHPGAAAKLAMRKLDIVTRALDLGWTPWNLPLGRAGTRRPSISLPRIEAGLRWAQLVLIGVGIWLLSRRGTGRITLLLAAPIAGALLTSLIFFGYVRLGAVVLPFSSRSKGCVGGVAGRLPQALRSGLARPLVAWILTAAALAVLILARNTGSQLHRKRLDRPAGRPTDPRR